MKTRSGAHEPLGEGNEGKPVAGVAAELLRGQDEAEVREKEGGGKMGMVALLIVVALLVARFATESPRKLLWLDELYTFYQVEGMSLGRFFESLGSGANLMPPVYFLVLWVLGQMVELTPEVLRAVSLLALVGCVPVLFSTLKRVVTPPIAALAIGAVFLTDPMVWDQGVEARPYALGVLLVALLAETLVATSGVEPGRGRWDGARWWWLVALNFLLPATHYFLGLYGAIALTVVVGVNLWERRRRWRTYLAFGLGWALFVVSCGPILWRQLANVGAGTGWIRVSTRADVWRLVSELLVVMTWVLAAVAVARGLARWVARRGARARASGASEAEASRPEVLAVMVAGEVSRSARVRPLVCWGLALGWGAFPLAAMVLSGITRRGVFVDRYFAPSVVGMVLLLGLLGECVWRRVSAKAVTGAGGVYGARSGNVMILASVVLATVAVLAGVRWMRTPAAWAPGREKLATEIRARAEVKVSDDEHAYFHALYYGSDARCCLLICNDEAARARWRMFSDNVRAVSDEEVGRLQAFVWLSPETRRNSAELAAWAERRGYVFQRRSATEADGTQKIGWRTYYDFVRR